MLKAAAPGGSLRADDDHRLYDATGKPLQVGGVPPSFPEHVRRLLERQIIAGALAPGQRVTEDDLARSIGVSRTPVREAMRGLEAQGLITRWRGRGAFVAGRMSAEEAAALYQIRGALESHLTARAAERISAQDLAILEHLQAEFREAAAGSGSELRHLIVIDSDFHWTIFHAADSELVSVLASYWGRLQCELYDRVYTVGRPEVFGDQHLRIVQALSRQATEEARSAMAEHIRTGWEVLEESFRTEKDGAGAWSE